MNIRVKTIPHSEQRYPTIGDWWIDDSTATLEIRVSELGNVIYEMLVATHEIDEALLCLARGVHEKDVTDFDMEFEKNRKEGNEDEPGDDPKAPYRREHFFATTLERMRCAEFGLDWKEYEEAINNLLS